MVRDELSVLAAFLTVAEERSFTRRRAGRGLRSQEVSEPLAGRGTRGRPPECGRVLEEVIPGDEQQVPGFPDGDGVGAPREPGTCCSSPEIASSSARPRSGGRPRSRPAKSL